MKNDKQKALILLLLYLGSIAIMFLGLFFSIFSFVNHISFKILSSSVPGVVFGVLVLYLGIRYYLSVEKFKGEFLKSTSKFSWSNFKRKKNKVYIKER